MDVLQHLMAYIMILYKLSHMHFLIKTVKPKQDTIPDPIPDYTEVQRYLIVFFKVLLRKKEDPGPILDSYFSIL